MRYRVIADDGSVGEPLGIAELRRMAEAGTIRRDTALQDEEGGEAVLAEDALPGARFRATGEAGGPPLPVWPQPPADAGAHPARQRAPSYLALAIFTTTIGCLPFGLVALASSILCISAQDGGRAEDARRYSTQAAIWGAIGLVIAVLAWGTLWATVNADRQRPHTGLPPGMGYDAGRPPR
jgi:hypothetical protein